MQRAWPVRSARWVVLGAVVSVVGACSATAVTGVAAGPGDTVGETRPSETAEPSTAPSDERVARAEAIASELVARIRAGAETGDYGAAADMWSGYPYPEASKLAVLEAFVDENRWLVDAGVRFDVVDAWSRESPAALSVVALTDLEGRGTAAILVDEAGTIERMQTDEDIDGPVVVDGSRVVVPALPVEGGLVAYRSGEPLDPESVAVDAETGAVVITLPDRADGDRALLIVSMATPELPTAMSVLLPG